MNEMEYVNAERLTVPEQVELDLAFLDRKAFNYADGKMFDNALVEAVWNRSLIKGKLGTALRLGEISVSDCSALLDRSELKIGQLIDYIEFNKYR